MVFFVLEVEEIFFCELKVGRSWGEMCCGVLGDGFVGKFLGWVYFYGWVLGLIFGGLEFGFFSCVFV